MIPPLSSKVKNIISFPDNVMLSIGDAVCRGFLDHDVLSCSLKQRTLWSFFNHDTNKTRNFKPHKVRNYQKDCYPVNVGLWNLALSGSADHFFPLFPDHTIEKILVEYEKWVREAFDSHLGIDDVAASQWDEKIKSHMVLGFAFLLGDKDFAEHERISLCVLELTHDEMEELKKNWRNEGVKMLPGETVDSVLRSTFGRLHREGGWDKHFMDFFKLYEACRNELIRKGYASVMACT